MRDAGPRGLLLPTLCLLASLVGACTLDPRLRSDAEMRARFQAHRALFDRLVERTATDSALQGVTRSWPMGTTVLVRDSTGLNGWLSADEIRASGRDEILRLLEQAGLRSVGRDESGDLWIEVDRQGRWRKGFMYRHRRPEELVAMLDGKHPDYFQGYVELAPGWYIHLYFTPE